MVLRVTTAEQKRKLEALQNAQRRLAATRSNEKALRRQLERQVKSLNDSFLASLGRRDPASRTTTRPTRRGRVQPGTTRVVTPGQGARTVKGGVRTFGGQTIVSGRGGARVLSRPRTNGRGFDITPARRTGRRISRTLSISQTQKTQRQQLSIPTRQGRAGPPTLSPTRRPTTTQVGKTSAAGFITPTTLITNKNQVLNQIVQRAGGSKAFQNLQRQANTQAERQKLSKEFDKVVRQLASQDFKGRASTLPQFAAAWLGSRGTRLTEGLAEQAAGIVAVATLPPREIPGALVAGSKQAAQQVANVYRQEGPAGIARRGWSNREVILANLLLGGKAGGAVGKLKPVAAVTSAGKRTTIFVGKQIAKGVSPVFRKVGGKITYIGTKVGNRIIPKKKGAGIIIGKGKPPAAPPFPGGRAPVATQPGKGGIIMGGRRPPPPPTYKPVGKGPVAVIGNKPVFLAEATKATAPRGTRKVLYFMGKRGQAKLLPPQEAAKIINRVVREPARVVGEAGKRVVGGAGRVVRAPASVAAAKGRSLIGGAGRIAAAPARGLAVAGKAIPSTALASAIGAAIATGSLAITGQGVAQRTNQAIKPVQLIEPATLPGQIPRQTALVEVTPEGGGGTITNIYNWLTENVNPGKIVEIITKAGSILVPAAIAASMLRARAGGGRLFAKVNPGSGGFGRVGSSIFVSRRGRPTQTLFGQIVGAGGPTGRIATGGELIR